METKKFWWVRHAPVIGNEGRCYGSNEVDCDLSDEEGFKYLVKQLPLDADVYTSHLSRSIKTFEKVSKFGLKYESITIDERFGEQNIGKLTGLTYEELENTTKKLGVFNNKWLANPDYCFPKGESFIDMFKRVSAAIEDIILNNKNDNIVIFSHGGPIKAAISYALKVAHENSLCFTIDNLALSRFDLSNDVWKIKFVNKLLC